MVVPATSPFSPTSAKDANIKLYHRSVGAVYLLPFLICASWALADDAQPPPCAERFQKEAPAGWKRMEQSMRSVSGKATFIRDMHATGPKYPKKEVWYKEIFEFSFDDTDGKSVQDSYDKAGTWISHHVYCFNADYAFQLKKLSQDSSYFVERHGFAPPTTDSIRRLVRHQPRGIRAAYALEGEVRPLADLIKAPDFHLIGCKDVKRSGNDLVEVEFEFNLNVGVDQGPPSRVHEQLLLDPGADWRVLSSVDKMGVWTGTITITYDDTSRSLANVAKVVERNVASDGAVDTYTTEFSPLSHEAPPRSQFLLTAFGLPEIQPEGHGGGSRLIWIGITLLVIGLLLNLLYRRREREKAAGLRR
jgi:hypothetical protein